MSPPPLRDNEDEALRLLRQIAQGVGTGTGEPQQEVDVDKTTNISGQTADGRVGLIPVNGYVTLETDDLDADSYPVTTGGTVKLEPGDSVPLVEYDLRQAAAIYAIGATDEQDVEYELVVNDQKTVGGRTNSPLGVLNDPFSFVQVLGGAVPVQSSARYMAHYSASATGTIELAGRMHLEVMG